MPAIVERRSWRAGLLLVFAALLARPAPARAEVSLEPFVRDLAFPTNMAFAPDGRLFFTEKDTGAVRIVTRGGRLLPEPFVRFAVANDGETGMLGVALHPDFEREPWVYLYFSDAQGGVNVLTRVRDEDGRAGAIQQVATFLPWSVGYHNGGDLLFGADGMLYLTVGEAHDPTRAQLPDDPGGKVLRLRPDGGIPRDNPFGPTSPAYSIGHRNSFGLCLDPDSGTIWETENGPDVDDEVNALRAGANYGWPEVTGDSGGRFADPVAVFPDPVALTGCAVWRGRLWFGAALTGGLYRMDLDPSRARPDLVAELDAPVIDVAVGHDGRLYVATATGIWRARSAEPPRISDRPSPPERSGPPSPASAPPRSPRVPAWIVPSGLVLVAIAALVTLARAARRRRSPSRPTGA